MKTDFRQKLKTLWVQPQKLARQAINTISPSVTATWKIRAFGLLRIPIIAFLGPKVIHLSPQRCEIQIPLSYRSKNHLNSLYLGAFAVGADLAVGLLIFKHIQDRKDIELVFADFHANFFKRGRGDTHFTCDAGDAIAVLVEQAAKQSDRVKSTIRVNATLPSQFGDQPIAEFQLTVALKRKPLFSEPRHSTAKKIKNSRP